MSVLGRSVSVLVVLFIEDGLLILIIPLCILIPVSPRVFFFLGFIVLIFSDSEGVHKTDGKVTSFPDNIYGKEEEGED